MTTPTVLWNRNTRITLLAVWIVLDIVLLVWAGVCVGVGVLDRACVEPAGIITGLLGISMVAKLLYGGWTLLHATQELPDSHHNESLASHSGPPESMRVGLIAVLAAICLQATAATDISLRTAVRFNTTCAKCHEGECSGRMSFDHGHEAAADHMRRYAGEVSPDVQRNLYALLAYMKRTCAYYPIFTAVPKDGRWGANTLAQLRSDSGNAYFVPLGELAAGHYRARLRFAAATEVGAQVISQSFEISDHLGLRTEAGAAEFTFEVERGGAYYLRLEANEPLNLVELQVAVSAR